MNVPGGKVEFEENALETAMKEFEEETGLKGDSKLKIISEKITINRDESKVEHHIIAYFYLATNLEGELKLKTREGDNIWINVEEMKDYERFPELDLMVPIIIDETQTNIRIFDVRRYRENEKFVDLKVKEIL